MSVQQEPCKPEILNSGIQDSQWYTLDVSWLVLPLSIHVTCLCRTSVQHVPCIPEIQNSGMLVGVDTSLFVPMGGVVSYYM